VSPCIEYSENLLTDVKFQFNGEHIGSGIALWMVFPYDVHVDLVKPLRVTASRIRPKCHYKNFFSLSRSLFEIIISTLAVYTRSLSEPNSDKYFDEIEN